MPILRAFIAIALDAETRQAVSGVQQRLKRLPGAPHVKWVAPDSLHLTLKFIGDLDSRRAPEVLQAVRHACAGARPFQLTLHGLGAFPDLQRPNVVWAGVGDRAGTAVRLAHRLEDECAALGMAREDRPFSPHLTLGRVRREASPAERQAVGEGVRSVQAAEIGRFDVEAVYLLRSDLRPDGAVYLELGRVPLEE